MTVYWLPSNGAIIQCGRKAHTIKAGRTSRVQHFYHLKATPSPSGKYLRYLVGADLRLLNTSPQLRATKGVLRYVIFDAGYVWRAMEPVALED